MSFLVYEKIAKYDSTVYTNPDNVSLGGKHAIYRHVMNVKKKKSCRDDGAIEWSMTEEELIKECGEKYNESEPNKYCFIIDITPTRPIGEKEICEVKNVYGVSYDKWTVIAIVMNNISKHVKSMGKFTIKKGERNEVVREFLHLHGGIDKGDWKWGWGAINAALISKDDWQYFLKCLA